MKRTTAALASLALAGGVLLAAPPAHADEESDNWTVEQCTERYFRVVSIGEGLAHQNSVLTDERDALARQLEESQEKVGIMRNGLREQESRIHGLEDDKDELEAEVASATVRADRLERRLDRKQRVINRLRATVRRLR